MDSSGQPDSGQALGPFWAIVQADLKSLFKSRITYGWVLAAAFIQVIRTLGGHGSETLAAVVSSGLSDFVYIWALVIIGLSASAVSSAAGELADSIMSKSVTRTDYVLAKFASRISYTLVTFFLVTALLVGLGLKLEGGDYDALGLLSAVLVAALLLATLTALGVGFSIAIPNSVMAIIALLVLWYSMTALFPVVGFDVLSPGSIMGTLPDLIRGVWDTGVSESIIGLGAVSVAATVLSSGYFYLKDI